MSTDIKVSHVEDHTEDIEGGTCGHCGRKGLRWIVVMSDGSKVGQSCMKKVLGWNVTPKQISWMSGKTLVATYTDVWPNGGFDVWTLWENAAGGSMDAMNGHLMNIGGSRKEWEAKGWI